MERSLPFSGSAGDQSSTWRLRIRRPVGTAEPVTSTFSESFGIAEPRRRGTPAKRRRGGRSIEPDRAYASATSARPTRPGGILPSTRQSITEGFRAAKRFLHEVGTSEGKGDGARSLFSTQTVRFIALTAGMGRSHLDGNGRGRPTFSIGQDRPASSQADRRPPAGRACRRS